MAAAPASHPWFALANVHEVPSPALLVYPDRVEENVRRMIALVGGTARLRPHMKTHKMAEVIRLQVARGIRKFKCATLAEAEITAEGGAEEVLLAYQPVGPNVARLLQLQKEFPGCRFATITDDPEALRALADAAAAAGQKVEVWLDIDCGQHRCGIEPGPVAHAIYRQIHAAPSLVAGGLHVYDGHIHDSDPAARARNCESAFEPVMRFREELKAAGLPVARVVAGGSPTFPIHARRPDVECSPGTCVLWDAGYASKLADLDFLLAAALLTRVVSKPGGRRICLDLGHKAVASEMPHPRVQFPELPDAKALAHSEEHLVVETARAGEFKVGDALHAIPWHICPTVALHATAVVVRRGQAEGRWSVRARDRLLE